MSSLDPLLMYEKWLETTDNSFWVEIVVATVKTVQKPNKIVNKVELDALHLASFELSPKRSRSVFFAQSTDFMMMFVIASDSWRTFVEA